MTLGANVTAAQLLQARSPSLDLDSLYGAGPQDPDSAGFYSDGLHLKMGDTVAAGGPAMVGFDLAAVLASGTAGESRGGSRSSRTSGNDEEAWR